MADEPVTQETPQPPAEPAAAATGSDDAGSGRPKRRRGGRGRGKKPGQGDREQEPGARQGKPRPSSARRGRGAPPSRGGKPGQATPLEVAVRSTGNAIRRHAESLRDDQSRLVCRSVLMATLATARQVSSPAEMLGVFEQVAHVVESSHRDDSQLPVALRAAVNFATESPRLSREVSEMLRLCLRHGYAVAADHMPRQLRDDGSFRASSLADLLAEHARAYLDDETFERLVS